MGASNVCLLQASAAAAAMALNMSPMAEEGNGDRCAWLVPHHVLAYGLPECMRVCDSGPREKDFMSEVDNPASTGQFGDET